MPPPVPENDASALEELRQRLYTNAQPIAAPVSPTPVSAAPVPQAEGWQPEPLVVPKKTIAWSVTFLFAALGIFVLALGVAAYFLVFGGGAISTDHVDITVAPIIALRSGDVATLLITVTNNNPTAITNTALSIAFPDTARSADDPRVSYPRYEDTLGDIPAGGSVTRTVRVVLSGSSGEVITLPLKLEYKTEGSNAVFVKEVTHDVTVTSSPLSVQVSAPFQASGGEEIAMRVTVHSDSPTPLEHVAVLAEYPFGFIPTKTDGSGTLFEIGTLAPGSDATVTVRGTLSGEEADERVFRFRAGIRGTGDTLALTYASGQGVVNVSRPFLATTFAVNGSSGSDAVVAAGKVTEVRLSWVNTFPVDVTDAQVSVKLSGDALDSTSIIALGGFYRSLDQTVLFARDTNPGLARMIPGATGNGSFTFSTKSGSTLRNPTITAVITATGRASSNGGTPTPLSTSITKVIQVGTELGLAARSSRTSGPVKNTGPIPPQPNIETTYTMLLSFTSSVNSVAGATARAVLPSYVRFVNAADSSVTYDANTRMVSWSAGEVAAGTSKQGTFQVALLPSFSQRGTSPVLMSSITFSGTDRFTKRSLEGRAPDVTTQTTGDPGYQSGNGEVAR
ncbi:MAG: hypothetical protein AAB737_02350 [Patescibacteria group bacterium]